MINNGYTKIDQILIYRCFRRHIKSFQVYFRAMGIPAMVIQPIQHPAFRSVCCSSHVLIKNSFTRRPEIPLFTITEYVSQPISFNESDFKRRISNDKAQNEHDGVEVPFEPDIIDFNGTFEVCFSTFFSNSYA